MPILLHGLVPSGTTRADLPDHDVMECGPFAGLVSPAPAGLDDLGPDEIAKLALRHNAVLVAYCTTCAVLPLRFGTGFSTTGLARHHLLSEAESNQRALMAVSGLTEYTLRVTVLGDPPLPDRRPSSGRDFLAQGRDLRDRRKLLADGRTKLARDLREGLRRHCHQVAAAGAPKPDRLIDLAVLIAPAALPALTRLAGDVAPQAAALGLDVRLTGPWPAYSFKPDEVIHGA